MNIFLFQKLIEEIKSISVFLHSKQKIQNKKLNQIKNIKIIFKKHMT